MCFSVGCNNVQPTVFSTDVACENNVGGRDTGADGNLKACISSQIEKGNRFAVWWQNKCYGTNTCTKPYNLVGTVNYDVQACGK